MKAKSCLRLEGHERVLTILEDSFFLIFSPLFVFLREAECPSVMVSKRRLKALIEK
jgi:hypothetical protein